MIVKYIGGYFTYKDLILNQYYFALSINEHINLLGFTKNYVKDSFVLENDEKINIDNYLFDRCLTKKNIHAGDEVICYENYGNDDINIGEVYVVENVLYFGKNKFRIQLERPKNFSYIKRYNTYEPNMFLKYDSNYFRFLKMLEIFNNVILEKNQ